MSHYTRMRTVIREEEFLVRALHEMGYAQVERHSQAQHLFGYQGDQRPECAEVIIRRQYVGRLANDVGFRRNQAGEYEAIISEYDRGAHCKDTWMQELNRRYAYHVVKEQMREENRILEEEQTLANGDVVLIYSERG